MNTTETAVLSRQAELLRNVLTKEIDVEEIVGVHNHQDLRSSAEEPATSRYHHDDCPACLYRTRALAELAGDQPLSVGLVGRCCDHLGVSPGQLLADAQRCPAWCTEHNRASAVLGGDLASHDHQVRCPEAVTVLATLDVNELEPQVTMWSNASGMLTAGEARQVAAAILEAAALVEQEGAGR